MVGMAGGAQIEIALTALSGGHPAEAASVLAVAGAVGSPSCTVRCRMPNPSSWQDPSRQESLEGSGFQLPPSLAHSYRNAQVIGAACAASSWARARLAALDDAPQEIPQTEERVPRAIQAPTEWSSEAATPASPVVDLETEAPIRAPIEERGPSAIARVAARARSLAKPIARWLPRVSVVAVVLAVGATGRAYWLKTAAMPKTGVVVLESVPSGSQVLVDGRDIGTAPTTATLSEGPHTVEFRLRKATRTLKVAVAAGDRIVERVDWTSKPTGTLLVSAEPSGARVIVDGTVRGVTPLTIEDLTVGSHAVALESAKGSIERSVTIKAGETARLEEVIYAGWLAVFSPFDLAITEGTHPIRLDDRSQILLPPGPHEIRLENRALGFEEVRRVEVKPGEVTSLSVVPPRSALTVTATAPAEVWLDRVHVGQTPLVELPVELGTREVMVKNAAGDERRLTVTVTVKPATLNIDFSKPMSNRGQNADRRQALR